MLPVVEAAILRAGNKPTQRADFLATLAELHMGLDRLPEAHATYTDAIAMRVQARGEDAEVARQLNRLAGVAQRMEHVAEARAHVQRASDRHPREELRPALPAPRGDLDDARRDRAHGRRLRGGEADLRARDRPQGRGRRSRQPDARADVE